MTCPHHPTATLTAETSRYGDLMVCPVQYCPYAIPANGDRAARGVALPPQCLSVALQGDSASPRRHKYGVAAKEDRTMDGIVFASKKEMTRYAELKLMEKAGEIGCLEIQVGYPLVVNGKTVGKYVADFDYWTDGKRITEDVKGMRTPIYRLKKKMFEAQYGRPIKEV